MSDLNGERWRVDFGVSKSIRYHAYRRSFWEAFDNWSKGLAAFSGTAVFVSVVGKNTFWTLTFAVAVALLGSADLVLGFGDRTRTHDALYRRFSRLAQDIAETTKPTEEQICQWQRQRLEIEMDEPGVLDWLERRCAAEECKARGCEIRPDWKLPGWKIALSQFAMWPSIPSHE